MSKRKGRGPFHADNEGLERRPACSCRLPAPCAWGPRRFKFVVLQRHPRLVGARSLGLMNASLHTTPSFSSTVTVTVDFANPGPPLRQRS